MLSSDSDLTDLDEEEVPLSQSARGKGKGKSKGKSKDVGESGYRIRGALKVPRATTYTCQALFDQISAQDIDLQPEYQRAVVWPDSKQIGLIDSIFRNFYVPPVIFVVHAADDGGERRVCVDGKQRLTSIYRFIAGEIPYKDAFTGEKFVFTDIGRIKAQLLPDRYKKLFLNKQIVCMEYQDITPTNEREIFQRVQLGMALTPAEKLQAINGPHADFIRELLETYIADQLATQISWDVGRANDFRGVATAVYCCSRWPHLNTTPANAVIESWLQEADDLDDDFREDMSNTFQIFCELAKSPKLNKPFWLEGIKKVAPVEVLAITILIHANKRKLSLAQLSEAIRLMRLDIRKAEKDVRANTRTFKGVIAFLKGLKKSQLTADSNASAASATNPGGKRKRAVASSSDDEDEESMRSPPPPPRTPKVAAPPTPTTVSTPASTSTARAPPTGPAALRTTNNHSVSQRPTIPAPPSLPSTRPNALGDSLMARMGSSASQPMQNGQSSSRDPRRMSQTQPHPPGPSNGWR